VCSREAHEVQVKAVAGTSGDRLTAAAFGPMEQRLAEGSLPDYLIVSYDRPRSIVTLAEFISGASLDLLRITARSPLSAAARRAGWIGSTIELAGLERHVVVGPSFEPEIRAWR